MVEKEKGRDENWEERERVETINGSWLRSSANKRLSDQGDEGEVEIGEMLLQGLLNSAFEFYYLGQ